MSISSDGSPSASLTHLDEAGRPRMVEVGDKPVTDRVAEAVGWIRMASATFESLQAGRTPKGDPLQVAELAGIMAGKRTGDLIPLCHQLPGASVTIQLSVDETIPGVRGRAVARFTGKTGVEMEALTGLSIALLTVYDMLKAVDREMEIGGVRLIRKSGGRSGAWSAPLRED